MRRRQGTLLGAVTSVALMGLAVIPSGFVLFNLAGTLSRFPDTFAETPLYWWPETSPFTVFCFLGLLCAAALSQWMVDNFKPVPTAAALLGLGAAAVVTSFYFDSFGGTAIYPDRIETREAAPGAPLRRHRLIDVARVEVGCTFDRGDSTRPMYILVFPNDERVYLDNGLTSEPRSPRWVAATFAVDKTLRAHGKAREVARNIYGDPNNSRGCVRQFVEEFPADHRGQVHTLMAPAGR